MAVHIYQASYYICLYISSPMLAHATKISSLTESPTRWLLAAW